MVGRKAIVRSIMVRSFAYNYKDRTLYLQGAQAHCWAHRNVFRIQEAGPDVASKSLSWPWSIKNAGIGDLIYYRNRNGTLCAPCCGWHHVKGTSAVPALPMVNLVRELPETDWWKVSPLNRAPEYWVCSRAASARTGFKKTTEKYSTSSQVEVGTKSTVTIAAITLPPWQDWAYSYPYNR